MLKDQSGSLIDSQSELKVVLNTLKDRLTTFGYPAALFTASVVAQSSSYLDLLLGSDNISLPQHNLSWGIPAISFSVFIVNFSMLTVTSLIATCYYYRTGQQDYRAMVKAAILKAAELAFLSAIVSANAALISNLIPLVAAFTLKFLIIFGAVGSVMLPTRAVLNGFPTLLKMMREYFYFPSVGIVTYRPDEAPQNRAFGYPMNNPTGLHSVEYPTSDVVSSESATCQIREVARSSLIFILNKFPPDVLSSSTMATFNSYAWQNLIPHTTYGALLDVLLTGTVSVTVYVIVKLVMKGATSTVRLIWAHLPAWPTWQDMKNVMYYYCYGNTETNALLPV